MKKQETKLTIRMHTEIAEKLAYIASYYGRSVNGQFYWLAKQEIAAFEKEHGKITPEDLSENQ